MAPSKRELIKQALRETVEESGPTGAPSGIMYAAVMGVVDLVEYESIMAELVNEGVVRKSGHVYYKKERI